MESPDREVPLYLNTEDSLVWRVQIERFYLARHQIVTVAGHKINYFCRHELVLYIHTYIYTCIHTYHVSTFEEKNFYPYLEFSFLIE